MQYNQYIFYMSINSHYVTLILSLSCNIIFPFLFCVYIYIKFKVLYYTLIYRVHRQRVTIVIYDMVPLSSREF